MKRKEIKSRTIKQDNDTSCIGMGNGRKESILKRAKRLSSKRLRQILKKEDRNER